MGREYSRTDLAGDVRPNISQLMRLTSDLLQYLDDFFLNIGELPQTLLDITARLSTSRSPLQQAVQQARENPTVGVVSPLLSLATKIGMEEIVHVEAELTKAMRDMGELDPSSGVSQQQRELLEHTATIIRRFAQDAIPIRDIISTIPSTSIIQRRINSGSISSLTHQRSLMSEESVQASHNQQARFIEIRMTDSGAESKSFDIAAHKIHRVCVSAQHEKECGLIYPWSLKLLIMTEHPPERVRKHLTQHWKISDICFRAHQQLWSGAMRFQPSYREKAWVGYLIRGDHSWACGCTLAIVTDTSSRTTYGICIGLRGAEIEELTTYMVKNKTLAENPLFVPIALGELYIPTTAAINAWHKEDFFNIQTAMKTDRYMEGPRESRDLDLIDFASKLTALATSSSGVGQLCRTQNRILQFLEKQFALQKDGSEMYDDSVFETLHELREFAHQFLAAESQNNAYIKEAVQAQAQMVYSLTAQRDNELNLRIAKLSQKRNELNLSISRFAAEKSHLNTIIARHSLRHGLDMRIITAITLIFLPGTFVATLFSASFWNFQPGNSGPVVSKWVSLYWVLTLILTLAVLAAWRFFSARNTVSLKLSATDRLDNLPKIDHVRAEE